MSRSAAARRAVLMLVTVAVSATILTGCGGHPEGDYLALGDSIAFGYQPPGERPPPDYHVASGFVGYPEDVAETLHLHLVNVSCPGETVASTISTSAPSNGCENSDGRAGGYRTHYPLHTEYTGSQLAFAVGYLKAHTQVRLVTIDLGINDFSVCAQRTSDSCTSGSERSALRNEITSGLRTIYLAIRGQAGYHGKLVALTYYQTYSGEGPISLAIDAVLGDVTRSAGGIVADGYGAFARASKVAGGDSCRAGLLIPLRTGGCDEHPTKLGQEDLAAAVVAALKS